MKHSQFNIDNHFVRKYRDQKHKVDPKIPYAFLVEPEYQSNGKVEDVATIFLTNMECPFHCLMCDLWKNTTDFRVSAADICDQLEYALKRLPSARHIKIYNSGNFFDPRAIPFEAHDRIADILKGFQTVIVENHPKLTSQKIIEFRDKLNARLQVAIGLEVANDVLLKALNKQMSLNEFSETIRFLSKADIDTRAFILLRPPFLTEQEGIREAKNSISFAFDTGVECCVVIPTRRGNGALAVLEEQGHFHPPHIQSLEEAVDFGLKLKKGRVFADLWDLHLMEHCPDCFEKRKNRLDQMNGTQNTSSSVLCKCDLL